MAITSATGVQNSLLNVSDVVSVQAVFSEAVTVTGTPRLALDIGGTPVQATYVSGSGTNMLVFSYTILAGQTDANGISVGANALNLNGGTILDAAGNAATLTHALVADNAGFKVDTTAPTAPTVGNTQNADGTLKVSGAAEAGSSVTVTFPDGSTKIVVADSNGAYSADSTNAQPQGAITVTATDLAGNVSIVNSIARLNTAPVMSVQSGDAVSANAAIGANAGGTLTVVDAERADTASLTVSSVQLTGGTFVGGVPLTNAVLKSLMTFGVSSLAADAGDASNISWIFNTGAASFAFLPEGQTLELTYTLNASDSLLSGSRTVTVTGRGGAPDVTSIVRAGTTQTDANEVGSTLRADAYLNLKETNDATDAARFTVNFDKRVGGVLAGNFAIIDLAGQALSGLSLGVVAVSPDANGRSTQWTVTVSGLNALSSQSASYLKLKLASAAGITDEYGRTLARSYDAGEAYQIDTVAPQMAALTSSVEVSLAKPVLAGRGEAGSNLEVTLSGVTYLVRVNANGLWVVDTATAVPMAGGSFSGISANTSVAVTLKPVDDAGNVGVINTVTVSRSDNVPTIVTQGATNDTTPVIEGSAQPNSTVRVTISGASFDVTSNGSGQWTLDTGTVAPAQGTFNSLQNGNYTITAVLWNNGAQSSQANTILQVDTVAPNAPQITSAANTTDDTPDVSGTASPGALVRVTISSDASVVYEVQADANGYWTLTHGVSTPESGTYVAPTASTSYTVSAIEIDAAGNVSLAATQSLSYDDGVVPVPMPAFDGNGDAISGDDTPLVAGTGEAGAVLRLQIGGATFETVVDGAGNWSVDVGTQEPVMGSFAPSNSGVTQIATITQIALSGRSSGSAMRNYIYDNQYPAITSTNITNDTTPSISGTAPVGTTVTLTIDGRTYSGIPVDAQGDWQLDTGTATAASGGAFVALDNHVSYAVTASIVTNGVTRSASQTLSIDTTVPASVAINVIASDDQINLAESAAVVITGTSESGAAVTLTFTDTQNVVQTRQAVVKADGSWSYALTATDRTVIGQSAVDALDRTITATAQDKAGNTATVSRAFALDTSAPVVDLDRDSLSNSYGLSLTQKNVGLSLDNGTRVGVTDASITESGKIAAVRIAFTRTDNGTGAVTGYMPQDGSNEVLLIGDQVLPLDGGNLPTQLNYAGLAWFIDYTAGVFTLTPVSAASAAAAQAMLRNIRFMDKNPVAVQTTDDDRNFTFTLVDFAGNTSAPVTSTVSSDGVAPTLDLNTATSVGVGGAGHAATVTGTTLTPITGTVSLVEARSQIGRIELSVGGAQDGANELISVSGATGATTSWRADGSGFANGSLTLGGVNWTISHDSGSTTFAFSRSDGARASVTESRALIEALRYQNNSTTATDGARSFKFVVTDGVGNDMQTAAESVLSYNASLPVAASTNPLVTTDGNGDGIKGDQFTINFSELVKVSNVIDTANWTLLGSATLLNGTFDTNASWTAAAPNSLMPAYDSTNSRWLFNSGNDTATTAGGTLTSTDFATVAGATYTVTFKVGSTVDASLGGVRLDAQTSAGTTITSSSVTSKSLTGDTYTVKFVASTTLSRLVFTNTSASASADVWLDDVVLTSPSLGAGASIVAQDVQTIDGVDYARNFLFQSGPGYSYSGDHQTGGTGSSNQLETTFTIAAANVIDTGGNTASGPVTFKMTDITAPVAPTPPLNIATDNLISVSEKTSAINVGFVHPALLATGDSIRLYRDGIDITGTSGVSIASGGVAGSGSNGFTLTGAAWGADGTHSFAVRIIDAAGNLGSLSPAKSVTVDSGVSQELAAVELISDVGTLGVPSAGDVIRLKFNESVSIASNNLQAAVWGTGATVRAISPIQGPILAISTFDADFDGWVSTANSGQAPVWAGSTIQFQNSTATSGGTLTRSITTVPGEVYIVTYIQTGANAVSFGAYDGGNTALGSGLTSSVSGTFTYTFTATGTSTQLRFADASSTTGTAVSIDNVRLNAAYSSAVWEVTLGSNPSASLGLDNATPFTIVDTKDRASNTDAFSGTVPASLYPNASVSSAGQPGSILIDNVSSDNVIAAADTGVTSVAVKLTGAAVGDVVKLYMDGVLVGTQSLGAGDLTTASVAFDSGVTWGGDGERALTATIQRGSGTLVESPLRSVYVTAEGSHWSTTYANTIWFDPDTLIQAEGAQVSQWSASIGKTASAGALSVNSTNGVGMVILSRDASGHVQLVFDGSATLASNDSIVTPSMFSGFSDFSLFKTTAPMTATSYTLTRYLAKGTSWVRNHYGTYSSTGVTEHISGDAVMAGQMSPSNSITQNAWMTLNGYSTGALFGLALDNRTLSTYAVSAVGGTQYSAAQVLPGQAIVIGGTGSSALTNSSRITALMADQIMFQTNITQAERDEVATYLAQKYAGVGTQIDVTSKGATYDLTASANSSSLLDDVLQLGKNHLGTGNDVITVAGTDYVNAGAGNDTIYAKDLKFRTLDGGLGFDTFALHAGYSNTTSGSSFLLGDYVTNARGNSGNATADARVNANGYHKLLGIEKLDFSRAAEKQTVMVTFADIDQLAEKNLAGDPQAAASTSNLYVVLGSNDYLDASGLGTVRYGFWQDPAGTAYDRKYQGTVGSDTTVLYAHGGEDVPDFGRTATSAVFGNSSVAVDFSELMTTVGATASGWTVNSAGSSISSWQVGTSSGKSTLTMSGTFSTGSYLDMTYTGSAITDLQGDQVRYKGLVIGLSTSETINLSGKAVTHTALGAGYAVFGNDGGDTIIGSAFDDLIIGGAGNDTLTGGLGADTFRAVQFEGGTDVVTDFSRLQGDKIDLRGILIGTEFDSSSLLSNLNAYLQITPSGSDMIVKVDDNGVGGFTNPGFQYLLQGANTPGNLKDLDLQALITQMVILV